LDKGVRMLITNLLTTNSKLERDNILSWNLPAGKTCPNADKCLKGCYAMAGLYLKANVRKRHLKNFELSKSPFFVDLMKREIEKKKPKIVRIHASGDFYSLEYLHRWIEIVKSFPNIKFYAYTKMISMVKSQKLPENFIVIFSEGGKEDHLISESDRRARVFHSLEELKAQNFEDTSKHDIKALGINPRIGLIYHGPQKKAWVSYG
jgi:hypothetical protein